MGYGYYIQGQEQGLITREQWQEAIAQVDGVRADPSGNDGAEVYFPGEDRWERVFAWDRGRISFDGFDEDDESEAPIRLAALALAGVMQGKVFGEDGEDFGP